MPDIPHLYSQSLALLTDLYQLTMANGYWKLGRARREAVFHLYFRSNPFNGGYSVACGLEAVIDYLSTVRFTEEDLRFLAGLTGNDGAALLDRGFLEALATLTWRVDIDAVPEGTVVFPGEPLVRVRGPILQAQLLETALLNLINFPTLVATKAARICRAAAGEEVLEFGLRRAQGIDGSLTACRAAFVGGCAATSNVLAGKMFGIPVRGTHAHSWVMSFNDELEAFDSYARAMPNNCVFLVDTYDTLQGVRHAAEVGKRLAASGHRMIGIRLDSGDLAYLSIEARKILDDAGLGDAAILASNDLDEHLIESLRRQGAKVTVWGVGTKLATAFDQPALGGVYKLSAIRDEPSQPWRYVIKASEQRVKASYPGILQVRRFSRDGRWVADMIYDEVSGPGASRTLIDPNDELRRKTVDPRDAWEDLLTPIFRGGKCVYPIPSLASVRQRAIEQVNALHPSITRLLNPHQYPVGLEPGLNQMRTEMLLQARSKGAREGSG